MIKFFFFSIKDNQKININYIIVTLEINFNFVLISIYFSIH